MTRSYTLDVDLPDGSKRITMKRACNGCGVLLGDVTEAEIERAIAGLPAEDVRQECPACSVTPCCEHHTNRSNGMPCDGACCYDCPGTAPNPPRGDV